MEMLAVILATAVIFLAIMIWDQWFMKKFYKERYDHYFDAYLKELGNGYKAVMKVCEEYDVKLDGYRTHAIKLHNEIESLLVSYYIIPKPIPKPQQTPEGASDVQS